MGSNKVFIATSMDGFIAKPNGNIDWLNSIPNPEGIDMGYNAFINSIDAIIMGRNSFETVIGFGIDWPYTKPVFVLSNTLKTIPPKAQSKAEIIHGNIKTILSDLNNKGFKNLYIDGGKTIQSFLELDLIDEMTITIIPLILGEGIRLFGHSDELKYKCVKTETFLNSVVQNTFKREK